MPRLFKTAAIIFITGNFIFLSCSWARAQKSEKGNSPDNPWNKEVRDDGYEFSYGVPSTYSSSLAFGDWKFETRYPGPQIVSKALNPLPGIFGKYLDAEVYNTRNVVLVAVDTIHVSATAPGNKPYEVYFAFRDSLIDQWDQVVLSRQHRKVCHFYRILNGTVHNTENGVDPFSISLIFNDSAEQPKSFIGIKKDSILIRPVFNQKEKTLEKETASYSSYGGFDFYKNDSLVGSARRKLNFVNEVKYVYWFTNTLNAQEQESVAAMIFIIAAFMK